MESYGILWNPTESYGNRWNPMECYGILCGSRGLDLEPCRPGCWMLARLGGSEVGGRQMGEGVPRTHTPELEELGGFPTDVNSPASRIIVFKSAILLNKMKVQSALTVWRKNCGKTTVGINKQETRSQTQCCGAFSKLGRVLAKEFVNFKW